MADTINRVLSDPALHLVSDFPVPHQSFHQDIHLEEAPNLNCRGNARACDATRPCDLDPCEWNCGGIGLGRLGCEFNKTSCKASAPARKAACEAGKSTEKASCEALKAMEIGGCELNQGWLNQWGGQKVGHIDVEADIQAYLDLLLRSVQIGEGLASASAKLTVNAKADIVAAIQLVPANVGHLACGGKWKGAVKASAFYAEPNLDLTGNVAFEDAKENRAARIVIALPVRTITIQLQPPPFAALLSRNPDLVIVCGPAVMGAMVSANLNAALGKEQPPAFTGRFSKDVGPFTQSFDVKPFEAPLPAGGDREKPEVFRLTPVWSGVVVAFVKASQ